MLVAVAGGDEDVDGILEGTRGGGGFFTEGGEELLVVFGLFVVFVVLVEV